MLTRRHALLAAAASVAAGSARAQTAFTAPPDLVAAARKEGRMVFYTASFTEVEQETIAAFNKRFPGIRVEMVRASGGQLITRVRTEAAAGKLTADVIDHSDRAFPSAYAQRSAANERPDTRKRPARAANARSGRRDGARSPRRAVRAGTSQTQRRRTGHPGFPAQTLTSKGNRQ